MTDVQVCYVCRFLWCVVVWSAATYLVFWKGASAWWYVLVVLITQGDCKSYRAVEAASPHPGASK